MTAANASMSSNAAGALPAFLRGVERRALVVAELQCGNPTVAEQALVAVMRAFTGVASDVPMAQWPDRFWILLAHRHPIRVPAEGGQWEPALAHLPTLSPPARLALLLRIGGGLDEAAAAQILDLPVAEYQQALAEACEAAQPLRDMLQEARWLTRGLSMRYDTLLRTTAVIIERQSGFLTRGEEAMAPLTLKEVADAIGMHESTVSRITTGKYLQTPRGTLELKHFFAVRLEGASVSGQAVKAMVRRLIDAEPAGRPLADEAIAGLLSRQGVNIARRTVAKYREQLDIAPARERRRASARSPLLARVG